MNFFLESSSLSFPPPPLLPPSHLKNSLKLECEKLANEKVEIQRHYVMVRKKERENELSREKGGVFHSSIRDCLHYVTCQCDKSIDIDNDIVPFRGRLHYVTRPCDIAWLNYVV